MLAYMAFVVYACQAYLTVRFIFKLSISSPISRKHVFLFFHTVCCPIILDMGIKAFWKSLNYLCHSLVTSCDISKTGSSRSCTVYESECHIKEITITLFYSWGYIKILGWLSLRWSTSFSNGLKVISLELSCCYFVVVLFSYLKVKSS